jgi:hypothetical protein
MAQAFPNLSRRTFLSASALATLAAAAPAAAGLIHATGPLAIASVPTAVPMGWTGPSLVLRGDFLSRLGQMRAALKRPDTVGIHLFLDDADRVLFDVASHDHRAHDHRAHAPLPLSHPQPVEGAAA